MKKLNVILCSVFSAVMFLTQSFTANAGFDLQHYEMTDDGLWLIQAKGASGNTEEGRVTIHLFVDNSNRDIAYINNYYCANYYDENGNFQESAIHYYPEDMVNEATGQTARQSAATALQRSKDFVQNFDHSFENLFIYGDTGVGKTFLTYCIAKELLDSMHSVIYYSAFDLFDAFARNTFSNSDTTEGENDYILNCDLLIIDDLGTELTNSFVASQFFLCINERILRKKSTVISTNLTLGSFMDTYSERVFSRVSSNYTMIKLIGKDIRIQKKILGGN